MFIAFLAAQASVVDFKKNMEKARAETSAEYVNVSALVHIGFAAADDMICERHLRDLIATPEKEKDALGFPKQRSFIDEWADARDLTKGERTFLAAVCLSYMDGRQADQRRPSP